MPSLCSCLDILHQYQTPPTRKRRPVNKSSLTTATKCFNKVKMTMLSNLPTTPFLRSMLEYFWDFTENDKRVAHWFLMEDVLPTTYICLFYMAFCIAAPAVLKVEDLFCWIKCY